MDGFTSGADVVVLASTNRADILDRVRPYWSSFLLFHLFIHQALVRPGRFDRQIYCDLPILSERVDIFKVHMRSLKLAADVPDIAGQMAAFTPGMRSERRYRRYFE